MSTRREPCTIGLALAGGGPEGALYELGALTALDEALPGLDLSRLRTYVGVSAGALVAACLANGITPREMCREAVQPGASLHPFTASLLYRPAAGEWVSRGLMVPRLVVETLAALARGGRNANVFGEMSRLARALPAGIFDNAPLRRWMAARFAEPGRTDDFRELAGRLIIVAAELDSGEAVRFGEPGRDDVPISMAVQASTALPGLYPPVLVDGRHYVDGVLLKTLHASVAFEHGVHLLFCVNPLVPVDTSNAVREGAMRRGRLVRRGLPTILSQTFRTLIHSRLRTGFAAYDKSWPDRDVLLIEPRADDYRMFFTNPFGFSARHAVCDLGFRSTRRELSERADEIAPMLARHGLALDRGVLAEESRSLDDAIGLPPADPSRAPAEDAGPEVTARLGSMLDRLEALLDDA